MAKGSSSTRFYFPIICVRPKALKACYPGSTSRGFPAAIFRKPSGVYWAPTRKGCQQQRSVAASGFGKKNTVWNRRSQVNKHYIYMGYFNIRNDDARQGILVIVGVTKQERKEFVAIEDGYRESEQSWQLVTGPWDSGQH